MNNRLTTSELLRIVMSSVLSAVVASLIMKPAGPRDVILALFVAGVFLAFAELFCGEED